MTLLVLAEKPELGRAIAKAMPNPKKEVKGVIEADGMIITWAYGHLLRLQEPQEYEPAYATWRIEDLPICFMNWKLIPDGNKASRIQQIKELMDRCDRIIHAGDPDDEGQFLIDEILDYLNNTKPVERVYINDNTPANIKKAFQNRISNEPLKSIGKSAYARAVADYVVGINYSRLFSIGLQMKGLSVGRVQSPTLGLIVTRDELIDRHKKLTYYQLEACAYQEEKNLLLKFKPNDNLLDDEKYILHRETLEQVWKQHENNRYEMEVTIKELKQNPPLPFNLVKLQAHMNSKYGFDVKKTDNITQVLRDKYQAITYNRSDSQYLKMEHYQEANQVVNAAMKKLNLDFPVDYTIQSACFNDSYVTAHHAIIPTLSNFNIKYLTKDEYLVYQEICLAYIMQFLPPIKKQQQQAIIQVEQGQYRATSTQILDKGYSAYINNKEKEEQEEEEILDFPFSVGKHLIQLKEFKIVDKQTKPLKRYTQGSLIKDMTSIAKYVKDPTIKELLKKKDKDKKGENGSIGTSATRAAILETLLKRGFVEMKGKQIISTQLGKDFYHLLPPEVKSADLTAKWWVIQEDIKENKATVETLVQSVLDNFSPHLQTDFQTLRKKVVYPIPKVDHALGKCPICGNSVVETPYAFGCVNYRNGCKFAIWKNDRFLASIHKIPTPKMVETLLSKQCCKVKIQIQEKEEIQVLQLGVRNGYATFRLLKLEDLMNKKK